MRAISSLVLAPVAAARVLPVWRRSWKRNSGRPTLFRAFTQVVRKPPLVRGRPRPLVKTNEEAGSG
ncbi:hypothetical protein BH24ACT10_BH24ACT10_17330 [soil metagenome]